jgi:hypothetical protein
MYLKEEIRVPERNKEMALSATCRVPRSRITLFKNPNFDPPKLEIKLNFWRDDFVGGVNESKSMRNFLLNKPLEILVSKSLTTPISLYWRSRLRLKIVSFLNIRVYELPF